MYVRGLLITIMGVVFVVPDALFVRLIEAPPLVVSFWRGAVIGLFLSVFLLFTQGVAPFRQVIGAGWAAVGYMVAVGVSGTLFTLSVRLTSVANVLFIIATMPVFAALFSRFLLGEALSRRMVITIGGVAAGLGFIAFGSSQSSAQGWWVGDMLALVVSAVFAAGLTMVRKVRAVSMVPALPMAHLGSCVLLVSFIDPFVVPLSQLWLVLAHGGCLALSAVGLTLGPRYISAVEVALLMLLEAVLAPLLVWWVIGEQPGPWALLGGAIVIGVMGLSNLVALRALRRGGAARLL
ncbi:MAG: DMT family transporter [Rhodobacteraceae bacterium]|nr:DMT family transporter [Paracoccaceae bacterium]